MDIGAFGTESFRLFLGVVARPDQRTTLAHLETDLQCIFLHSQELVGMHPSVDGEVVSGRLEVLTDRDDVRLTPRLDVIHDLSNLVLLLADPDHDPGLGDESVRLELLQYTKGSLVLRLRANCRMHPEDGFHVVGDYFRSCITDFLDVLLDTLEVTDQDLDTRVRAEFMHRLDRLGPYPGSTVGEIVTIDTGDDDMTEIDLREDLCDPPGFILVELGWTTGLHIAETTRSSAGVPEDHDGRGSSRPAFTHVRTTCFLAYGVELVLIDQRLEIEVPLTSGNPGPQPVRLLAVGDLLGSTSFLKDHPGEGDRRFAGTCTRSVTTQGSRVSLLDPLPDALGDGWCAIHAGFLIRDIIVDATSSSVEWVKGPKTERKLLEKGWDRHLQVMRLMDHICRTLPDSTSRLVTIRS